jgi:hypothetical protein
MSAHHHHHHAAGLPSASYGASGVDYHPVPDEPKPGTAHAGWMIVWLAGAFLSFSGLEQWDRGWVIANAWMAGSGIAVTMICVAAQAVRNARIRLNHMRTFTALAFTGTIIARRPYSAAITHITVRCDGDGQSIPFIVPDHVGNNYVYLADSLLVGRRIIKRAGERWPSLEQPPSGQPGRAEQPPRPPISPERPSPRREDPHQRAIGPPCYRLKSGTIVHLLPDCHCRRR